MSEPLENMKRLPARITNEQALSIVGYKYGSENEPGQEARDLAADLLDARERIKALEECVRAADAHLSAMTPAEEYSTRLAYEITREKVTLT